MEIDGIKIRRYKSADAVSAARVYRDSVMELGKEQYEPLQVEVWASYSDETEAFTGRNTEAIDSAP